MYLVVVVGFCKGILLDFFREIKSVVVCGVDCRGRRSSVTGSGLGIWGSSYGSLDRGIEVGCWFLVGDRVRRICRRIGRGLGDRSLCLFLRFFGDCGGLGFFFVLLMKVGRLGYRFFSGLVREGLRGY